VILFGGILGIREIVPEVTDEHRASLLGELYSSGKISRAEYNAGIDYAKKMLDYLKTIDAPSPYGADISDYTDEQCLQRKLSMAAARSVLVNGAGRKSAVVVDRVAVYGEQIAPEEIPLLCQGLKKLSQK
jgi:hypothetical protein